MAPPRRPYATDLSDARWALIEPVLSAWRQTRAAAGLGLSEPVHDLREIVNAILYVNRAGCAWQLLPHDLPPYRTACGYYARREKDGTTGAIHDLLRGKVREQAGPSPEPTAAITDARVVKTSSSAPEATQGYDAGKRAKAAHCDRPPRTAAGPGHHCRLGAGHQLRQRTSRTSSPPPIPPWPRAGPAAGTRPGSRTMPPGPASASPSSRKSRTRRGSPRCRADGQSSGPWDGSCFTGGLSGISRPSRNVPLP